ncbi:SNARE protein, putative [Hepatocystis sp. ex Piliocolobus tephrosceles]|nr:SNARE protein, putative [Hepatocystis sp. ex Piliocolobus tephrosceles]
MDLWNKDYEKAIETGKRIKKLLKQKEKGKDKTKNRAMLRGEITEFNQNVKFLYHQLDNDYIKNDKNYIKNESKYKSKLSSLDKIKAEIAKLYEAYVTTNTDSDSFNINMNFLNDYGNENNTHLNELNKEAFMMKQENLMKLQDEQLTFLEGTTHNLKNISYNINSELQIHNELLDDIDRDVDETNNLLSRNRNIFHRVTNTSSNLYLYFLIILLTITLFLLIIIL